MRRLFLFAGILLLAGCDFEDFGSSDRYTEDFHYNYPLKAGGRISLESFNGSIEISGWDQDTVDVSGAKYAATPEARDAIKIQITPAADSISIRTVRPPERRNCGARFVLKVPRRAELERIVSSNGAIRVRDVNGPARLRTSNGAMRVANLGGNLDGTTSNGSVEVDSVKGNCTLRTSNGRVRAQSVQGTLDASTSNGSVDAELGEVRNGVRVATSNGGITLRLPGTINARLMARTSNASISSDFDVTTHGTKDRHHLEGTIGSGGPVLDLSTSNGGIKVVRQQGS
jgi:DUF4097 and DUF4098 domain-containing protein YvlB